ncbi:MAG TPA: glycosyltransferase family 4 protein, partial [bacterium]|nr:glycosyltransferase family 4 protein [bacterium]
PEMKRSLTELLQKHAFDTVQVDYYFMMQNVPESLSQPVLLQNIVLDTGLYADCAVRARNPLVRLAYRRLARQCGAWELRGWKRADLNVAITPELSQQMRQLGFRDQIEVQLPGLDMEYYQPGDAFEQGKEDLVFVGAMRYPPNVDAMLYFCREVLPLIRERRPNIRLWIVGQHPVPEIVALGKEPNVNVTGFVDDVRPYWNRGTVAVLPLRIGGGVRLKMLEALAMGKAIVTTESGAEGSSAEPGKEFLQASSSEEMRDQILRLLDDGELRRTLQRNARQAAVNRYSWEICGQRFEKMHEWLLTERTC